jgi:hypothetical protein
MNNDTLPGKKLHLLQLDCNECIPAFVEKPFASLVQRLMGFFSIFEMFCLFCSLGIFPVSGYCLFSPLLVFTNFTIKRATTIRRLRFSAVGLFAFGQETRQRLSVSILYRPLVRSSDSGISFYIRRFSAVGLFAVGQKTRQRLSVSIFFPLLVFKNCIMKTATTLRRRSWCSFSPLLVFTSVKLKRATTVTRRCWCFFTNNINLQSVPFLNPYNESTS